ncbi:MAG: hypothetical protein MRQ07_00625 [Candidatus Midichloria sp.]|nr:hypothetical protein [Candidatus Midichloria sp.]
MIAFKNLKAAEDQVKEQAGAYVYHYEKVVHAEGTEPELAQGGDKPSWHDIH